MKQKCINIIGVPMDLGQNRRGVDMGPSAMRYAGIRKRLEKLGHNVADLGDLAIDFVDGQNNSNHANLRNLDAVQKVNAELAEKVNQITSKGDFPLVLGGDHSIALGTLAGVSKYYDNLGVIWIDAHGDLNTEKTSPSGNIHGMPLAASLGLGHPALTDLNHEGAKVKAENLVLIGPRALDEGEKKLVKEKGIRVYTMHEIDRLGMAKVMEDALNYLKDKTDEIHLSFDLDALDPVDAPGVGTPVIGGISYREGHLAMEMLAECKQIVSAEFVEVNPILDDKNKTAQVAVALIGSLLGERLL
ncbi:MAG: arginase [Tindallia sp. MSAO_Bac2]|nr:MAG: arginase [Tindallia sp. MSAO_Bac2]